MMVFVAAHSSKAFQEYASEHPGTLGWMLSPVAWKAPRKEMPFAVDNGAYTAWSNGEQWKEDVWIGMLDKVKASGIAPLWIAVPDVVADRLGTLKAWQDYSPVARSYGWPLAFVVQDGMVPCDVPKGADLLFVGGTTRWKWRSTAEYWRKFPRVHIGRVGERKLQQAERLGAESVDGSGFMRETWGGRKAQRLRDFIEGHRDKNMELAL